MRSLFVCFGLLIFLFEILGYSLLFYSPRYADIWPINTGLVLWLVVCASVASAFGIGLILMRRWAAIPFSIMFACVALDLIIGSIVYVPLPYTIINILLGLLMLLPLMATILGWNQLKWRGS